MKLNNWHFYKILHIKKEQKKCNTCDEVAIGDFYNKDWGRVCLCKDHYNMFNNADVNTLLKEVERLGYTYVLESIKNNNENIYTFTPYVYNKSNDSEVCLFGDYYIAGVYNTPEDAIIETLFKIHKKRDGNNE